MERDVSISITGRIESPEALDTLAQAIAADGPTRWWGGDRITTRDEALGFVLGYIEDGQSLVLSENDRDFDDDGRPLPAIVEACEELGLSYDMEIGDDEYDAPVERVVWTPDMDRPRATPILDGGPIIAVAILLPFVEAKDWEGLSSEIRRVAEIDRPRPTTLVVADGIVDGLAARP